MKKATINAKGMRRVRGGHPWVFRSDVLSVDAESGDAVCVFDEKGRNAGTAFYSAASQITLRFFDRGHVEVSPAYITGRLKRAAALRERLYAGAEAVRLCFGESDGLPALIIDRYGPVVAIQTLAPGPERLKDVVADWCMTLGGVAAVVERNEPKVRALEGLPSLSGVIRGTVPEGLTISEGGVRLPVEVLKGQKTGAFLDQRDNRDIAAAHGRGRILDAFCYHGWFSLRAAAGADRVVALDTSEDAVKVVASTAAALGLNNVEALCANAFDYLRECDLRGDAFDTVILDPPAFAKHKGALEAATRGYKEINLRAMKALAPGGHLFTFSCSYHVDEALFYATVMDAAADAGRRTFVVRRLAQSLDHPVLLGFPESAYLKGLLLRVE